MPDLIGAALGPYRIVGRIGAGGMATVYTAYQSGVDRLVAVKILPQQLAAADSRFAERFAREARIIAKLEHRNIIPIHDFGQQNSITYLVMRYLQAGTVKEILERGSLPLADTAKIINDVAAALDHAHAQGIVHRDVKPGNILVDKDGNAYLTDFGIAKVLEGTSDLTGSAMLGTPAYMAPEQTLGRAITPQTDIYALGVMLYEMVTGRLPFEADTPMTVALMHVSQPLPPPGEFNPSLPSEVNDVLAKALAKDPAERYQTAGEFAREFAAAIANAPTEDGASPPLLADLATEAATGKSTEIVTQEVREAVRRHESTERRQKVLRLTPWAIGVAVIIALAFGLVQALAETAQVRSESEQTATAVAVLLDQLAVAQTAAAGGGGPGAQATLQALQTQVAVLGLAAATDTPTPTATFTPTTTFTRTPTATFTRTPTVAPSATPSITPTVPRPTPGVVVTVAGGGLNLQKGNYYFVVV
jgi:serine/threonine-protein kinase